jgi:putative oxidoreductase
VTEVAIAARVVTGGAFLIMGLRNIAYREPLTELMRSRSLPLPAFVALGGIAIQILGGALLVIGRWPRPAGFMLAAFVVAATLIAHWPAGKTGAERTESITACLVNLALVGGLLANASLVRG